ncbi:hypothetical protein ACWDE9_13840 [Streptomyces olivaceoviridis]
MFHVVISANGTIHIDGLPHISSSVPAQKAALDELHRRAQAGGAHVEATVVDHRHAWTLRLRVGPDGASEILGPVTSAVTGAPQPVEAATEVPVSGSAVPVHEWLPDSPTTVLRRPAAPSAAAPVVPGVPADLARAVAHINEAVVSEDLSSARALAEGLRQHVVRTMGAAHPCAFEAYALEAYVAHLHGDQEHATTVSVYLARLRKQQGDPRAGQEVLRAAATWHLLADGPAAVALGRELLMVWEEVARDGGQEPDAVRARHRVESRLRALVQRVHPGELAVSA